MIKRQIITLILIASLLASGGIALASNITDAKYLNTITIVNDGTAVTNEIAVFTKSTSDMISGGLLAATADDCAILTGTGGSDIAFQPSINSTYPWVTWVSSIGESSSSNQYLYSKDVTGGEIRYFPADGGMTVPDNAAIEPGSDFEIEQKGWVDTDAGADKNHVRKDGAFETYTSPTVSGNITSAILGAGANVTSDMQVNADGDSVGLTPSAGDNWQCVSSGGDGTYVSISTDTEVDYYNLASFTPVSSTVWTIDSIAVYSRAKNQSEGSTGLMIVGLKLGGVTTTAGADTLPDDGVWYDYNSTVARPGGGNWAIADLANLQASLQLTGGLGDTSYCSQVFIRVNYTDIGEVASVTATGVASGEHTVNTTQVDNTGAGWLAGWDNRIQIDIDAGQVDASVTHFPVLLYLSSSSGIGTDDVTAVFDEVGANYLKIAITQDDGTTENYVEVEKWDSGGEEAWLWTSIAGWVIDDTTDTTIYLYYDNSHADNVARVGVPNDAVVQNVWDANFVLVDHLPDGAANTSTYDSTSNNNDGTKAGANQPIETTGGKVADAQDFNQANPDDIDYGNVADFDFGAATDFTLEAIIKNTDPSGYLLVKRTANSRLMFGVGMAVNSKLHFSMKDGVNIAQVDSVNSVDDDAWYYVAASCDRDVITGMIMTINDVEETPVDPTGVGNINAVASLLAGSYPGTPYDGIIDEIRVSKGIARSTAWRKATYYTSFDNFVDYIPDADGYLVDYAYDLRISIDGTVEDRTLGASVPDNANDWVFVENGSMTYMEYTSIDIGGVPTAKWEWEYDTTFTDSISSIVATPTFRTAASDADITASVTASEGLVTGSTPTSNVTGGWTMITALPATPDRLFDEGGDSWGVGGFNIGEKLTETAEGAGQDPVAWQILFAFGLALLAMFGTYSTTHNTKMGTRGSLILAAFAAEGVLIYFYRVGTIPGFALIPFGMIAMLLVVWRKSPAPVD